MRLAELVAHGQHVMTVCNACRYCEQLCPVFPAMEERREFGAVDLAYLANLCHNCGECLYACQYAPPHEFGIDVPKTFARLRVASYENYCWPAGVGVAFRRQGVATSVALTVLLSTVLLLGTWLVNPSGLLRERPHGDFYGVVPHDVMVGVFGAAALFAATALLVALARYWRDLQAATPHVDRGRALGAARWQALWPMFWTILRPALRDALTLRHLHSSDLDCSTAEEVRTPWRRWFHHATAYGFLLSFASTSVAAFYHLVLGRHAPYALASVPVVLGTTGGVALLVGTLGLMAVGRRRDRELTSPEHSALDASLLTTLALISATGLLLLALRDHAVMGWLLVVHLAAVLAFFLTLPYGKFVHGFYRLAALVKYHGDGRDG